MTAGEGCAVLFPDAETHERAFLRHNCGRPPADRNYLHEVVGTNSRLNEFSAALLRAQLRRVDERSAVREERWTLLSRLLGTIDGVVPRSGDVRADRNPHYMAMFRVPGIGEETRDAAVGKLVERGLPAFAAFRVVCRTPAFWELGAPDETVEQVASRCPNSEAISTDSTGRTTGYCSPRQTACAPRRRSSRTQWPPPDAEVKTRRRCGRSWQRLRSRRPAGTTSVGHRARDDQRLRVDSTTAERRQWLTEAGFTETPLRAPRGPTDRRHQVTDPFDRSEGTS